jgi:putative ABC transport system permease protein
MGQDAYDRLPTEADGGRVIRMVLPQALGPVGFGVLAGLALSFGLRRTIEGLLFWVEATDPIGLSGGIAVLLGTAVLAAYVPARGAGRVDPMDALRAD